MSTRKAAEILGVSIRRVQAMIAAGVLSAERDDYGRWRIQEAEAKRLAASERLRGRPKRDADA